MAKMSQSFSAKGELSVGEMRIYEFKKDETNVVNFLEILHEFDGKVVSITIKHDENYGEEDTE